MTFPTGLDFRKYSDEELTTMLAEAGEASKHARKLGRVMGVVAAHRIKDVKEFFAYQQLATWRRDNGFDRVEAVEKHWIGDHRSLPPTPEQYYAGLWLEVNALKDAISMPLQLLQLINAIEQDKLSDEEYATLKRCMEKRVRETAQVTAVTRDHTVQHCSPCSPNPDRPSGVHCNLENNEGELDPRMKELEELTSSPAGTGLNTPGQESPPNEGVWETGRIIADGILTAGVDSSKEGNISSPMESTERATRMVTAADIPSTGATPPKRRHKTSSEENKQFDPGGRGEQAPPWKAAVPLPFFSWGEAVRLLVCLAVAKLGGFLSVFSALCVCFSELIFFLPQVNLISKTFFSRREQVMYATGGQAFSRLLPYLKMARTSNAWFDRSANTLG